MGNRFTGTLLPQLKEPLDANEAKKAVLDLLKKINAVDLDAQDGGNIDPGTIPNSALADMPEATVKGRAAAAGTGVPQNLTATQLAAILDTIAGWVATAELADDAVTNPKAANMVQSTIKGRASGAGTGDPTDLTPAQVATVMDGATNWVANAELAQMAQSTIKGRASGAGTGDPTDLSVAQVNTILSLDSSTYSPTVTGVTNTDAVTGYTCQYLRVGSVVTVSGRVDIDPTTSGAATEVRVTVPIASNFSAIGQVGGAAISSDVDGKFAIYADTTNDALLFAGLPNTTLNAAYFFSATYLIV